VTGRPCVIVPDQQADIVAFEHLRLKDQLRVHADERSFAIDRAARSSDRILQKANVEMVLVALVVALGAAAFTYRAARVPLNRPADLSHYADIGAYRACEPEDEALVGIWLVRIPIAADYFVGTGAL